MPYCRRCLTRCCANLLRLDLWRCKVLQIANTFATVHTAAFCLGFRVKNTADVWRAEARPQWDGRQLEDLRRTAHSMKGSAGYLKADALIDSSITLMAAAEVYAAARDRCNCTWHVSLTSHHTPVCAQAGIVGDEADIPDALVRVSSHSLHVVTCCLVAYGACLLLSRTAHRRRGKPISRVSLST